MDTIRVSTPHEDSISAAAAINLPLSRATKTMLIPSLASCFAISYPIPAEQPVTIAQVPTSIFQICY